MTSSPAGGARSRRFPCLPATSSRSPERNSCGSSAATHSSPCERCRLWGARFRDYAIWCARFNHCGAREKVAAFLVSDSSRRGEAGYRAAYPTRRDIASLLGITPETLSRELSYFRRKGWVHVGQNGSLTVDDDNSLRAMISAC
ncbi:MAG: helix-turn-helix domain-containing protein [Gammaproteobacteria bacterium]|nr:helix-turn-helix domain-containing protein [Gammaproteobacteria bacterium]